MLESVGGIAALSLVFTNVFVMMMNFALKREAHYGKYSIVFIVTKTLLLPTIALAYCTITKDIKRPILEFAFFCWVGDVILLFESNFYMVVGGLFFALGHFIMMRFFDVKLSEFPLWGILLMVPSLYVHYFVLVPAADFRLPESSVMVLYITMLEVALAHAICKLRYMSITDVRFLSCFIGYEMFIVSDALLLMVELKLWNGRCRMGILGTYFLAVCSLILGNAN